MTPRFSTSVVGNYRSQGSDEANGQLKAKVLESGQIFLFSHGQDPKQPCWEMLQAREFWLYGLMGNNSPKDHRLGRIGKAAFAGKKCQHVHSIIERAA